MKNQHKIIILLLCIIGLIVLFYLHNKSLKQEIRMLQNQNFSLIQNYDSVNHVASTLLLKSKDLAVFDKILADSLNAMHIKAKNTKRITKLKISKEILNFATPIHDTIIQLSKDSTIKGTYFTTKNPCIESTTFIPFQNDTAFVTQWCIINGILVIHKGKRINQHYLFGWKKLPLFRTGEKRTLATFKTDCPGAEIYISDIEFQDE